MIPEEKLTRAINQGIQRDAGRPASPDDLERAGATPGRARGSASFAAFAAIFRRLAGPSRRTPLAAIPPDPAHDVAAIPPEPARDVDGLNGPPATPPPIPRGQPIGYLYDPVPKAIRLDPRLKPIDHQLMAILVSLAIWRRDSCWTTVAFLATRIAAIRPGRSGKATVCERTIQRSLGRLIRAGHLVRRPVPVPDPDDPRNATGYRYFFPCHAAPVPSAPAPTGVTIGSGDPLVTQARREVLEQEQRTFNVANVVALADPGGGARRPTGPTSPPVAIPDRPAGPPAVPTVAAMPVAESRPPDPRRAAEARALVRRIRSRGVHLWPDGEAILARPTSPGASAPCGVEAEALGRLRPEVLALLREMKLGPPRVGPSPTPTPVPPGTAPPPAGRPAPRVAEAARAQVRRRIGGLASPPDRPADKAAAESRPEALAFAEGLAAALGDRNPVSLATATGLAADVLRGDLAEACLHAAFAEACGAGKRNRGASFVAAVRRWRSEHGRARPGAWRAAGAAAMPGGGA